MTADRRALRTLLPAGERLLGVDPLHGDGSERRFSRVVTAAGTYILMAGPDLGENEAYARLARHLAARGVRVPRIHGEDPARGWVLMEDLGDRSLYAAVRAAASEAEVAGLYGPVLDLLVRLQVAGRVGYDPALGHFSTPYSVDLMIAEEGLYFARECAEGMLGLGTDRAYRADVGRLAALGSEAGAGFLLHRDFQSRNLHLTEAGPAVIDFQGCRPGPLGYDVAALVLDPYVALPAALRDQLLQGYRQRLAASGVAPAAFDRGWYPLGAFRLLQALGAFAKLGFRFGKRGFLEHVGTGLAHLTEHLGERGRREFPALSELVLRAQDEWRRVGPKLQQDRGQPGG